MGASTAWVREGGEPVVGSEPAFRRRLRELECLHRDLWRRTGSRLPDVGEPVARARQRRNAREAEDLIEDVARRCEAWPEADPARRAWRAQVRERVRRFGERSLGWPNGYRSLLLSDAFYDSSVAFVRETRALDPALRMEDVGQALRNVWIMNCLQLLFDEEVSLSPAVFGYSMLYPLTDNLLDDPGTPLRAKATFNHRLRRRLRGEELEARSPLERKVFALVERVEGQYPRGRFPGVYQSLLAIQGAQEASLSTQQDAVPGEADRILAVSVAKGGASVLADGYLVRGALGAGEEEFCFGYGVFLQLLDDLQDVCADGGAGHATLFTLAARDGGLDHLASRLHHFMHAVVEGSTCIAGPAHADRRDLILRNCTFLLVGSIAGHRHLFSPSFLDHVEERWPFEFSALSRLQERAERRFRGVARRLAARRGVREPLLALL